MLQLQNLAGQRLAQGQDGAAAELGKVHILAHLFAHLIILVNLACLRKGNLPVVILHLPVGHDRTVAVNFKIALVRIHDHVVVVVRAEELGDDATETLLQHAHQRGAVDVLRLFKLCKCINQTDGFCFLCHDSI